MARIELHERIYSKYSQRQVQRGECLRPVVQRRDGVNLQIDGRWLTSFCCDDYLGLSQQFELVAALADAASGLGVATSATPMQGGYRSAHARLESVVAEWLGYPAALLFGSRYLANLAVQQALLGEDGDLCVQDSLNHPSLFDATYQAGAHLRQYPHLDCEGAVRQFKAMPDGGAMLVSEGVFSVDGDVAPLRALSLAAHTHQALFYVDDSEGVGVFGAQGRGCVADAGLGVAEVPLQVVSLGKALGGQGALVLGDPRLLQQLAATSRMYQYSNAQPPAQAEAMLTAVKLAQRDDWRRNKLGELIATFRDAAHRHGWTVMASDTPIQSLLCGDEAMTLAVAAQLQQAGMLVAPVLSPRVPEDKPRLRITLTALHDNAQVLALLESLAAARELDPHRTPLLQHSG